MNSAPTPLKREFSSRHDPEPLPSAVHPKFRFNCTPVLTDWFHQGLRLLPIPHSFLVSPILVTSSTHRGPHSVKVTLNYDVYWPRAFISRKECGRKRSRSNRGTIPACLQEMRKATKNISHYRRQIRTRHLPNTGLARYFHTTRSMIDISKGSLQLKCDGTRWRTGG